MDHYLCLLFVYGVNMLDGLSSVCLHFMLYSILEKHDPPSIVFHVLRHYATSQEMTSSLATTESKVGNLRLCVVSLVYCSSEY